MRMNFYLRCLLFKSKECQIRSWNSTHKYNCQKRSAIHEDGDKENAREEKNLTSWLNAWALSLSGTATAALDLVNHESDYLLNHCLYLQLKKTGHKSDARRFLIDHIRVSHVDPLQKEYPELASMLADPPELVGERVRFLAAVLDENGEVERVRARVWTDGNIQVFRKMSKEDSRVVAMSFMTGLVGAVAAGDVGLIPKRMGGN